MAFVDFSNAQLHLPSDASFNITDRGNASLDYGYLFNALGQNISTNESYQKLQDESKKLAYSYAGTFTASGTEFYFGSSSAIPTKYKITGISFQSGDNYSFEIPVTLTCL